MKKSIRVTKNYDQFTSQVKGNRPINIGHLEKMIKIMKSDIFGICLRTVKNI